MPTGIYPHPTVEERLIRGRDEIEEGCWEWKRATNSMGYGVLTVNYRTAYAHRLAWEMENGPIPDGALVLHRCDNPRCVRPDHLFLGTHADNMADMTAKGRHRYGENRPSLAGHEV